MHGFVGVKIYSLHADLPHNKEIAGDVSHDGSTPLPSNSVACLHSLAQISVLIYTHWLYEGWCRFPVLSHTRKK